MSSFYNSTICVIPEFVSVNWFFFSLWDCSFLLLCTSGNFRIPDILKFNLLGTRKIHKIHIFICYEYIICITYIYIHTHVHPGKEWSTSELPPSPFCVFYVYFCGMQLRKLLGSILILSRLACKVLLGRISTAFSLGLICPHSEPNNLPTTLPDAPTITIPLWLLASELFPALSDLQEPAICCFPAVLYWVGLRRLHKHLLTTFTWTWVGGPLSPALCAVNSSWLGLLELILHCVSSAQGDWRAGSSPPCCHSL